MPKIFFSIIFLTLLFVCSTAIVEANEDSILTAHWDFNEGSGDIVYDSVGGYDGVRSGLTQWGDGYMNFDSGNISVRHGHVNTGPIPKNKIFTLIITVKIGAAQGDDSFLFINNGFQLRVAGGTQNAKLWGIGANDQVGIDMSGITTIAIVHNGSDIKTFKNGQYIQTINNAFSEDGVWDWYFGSSGSYLPSQYYDVKLYNIALTNDDVAYEFTNGAVNCTQDTWNCSSWEQCSINGTRIRSCEKTYDCSAVDTPLPVITQSCTPECTEDIWECGGWSNCSVDGNRSEEHTSELQSH